MKYKKFSIIVVSRFLTYALVLFIGVYSIKRNQSGSLLQFLLLFGLLMINSTYRTFRREAHAHDQKKWPFVLSIAGDMAIMLMMNESETLGYILISAIAMVDIFMFFEVKMGLLVSAFILGAMYVAMDQPEKFGSYNDFITSYLVNAMGLGFFGGAAHLIKVESEMRLKIQNLFQELKVSKEELEAANLKIKEYADTIEEVSILGERNRIAGEIHDTIGHSLTGLIMEIDLCDKLLEKNPEKCQQELKKASTLARETLAEVRKSVKAIKPDTTGRMTGLQAIEKLIKTFEHTSSIQVEYAFSKQQYSLTPTIEVTIYRVIQEALTNCAKHSGASKIKIQLNFGEAGIDVYIGDNGKGWRQGEISGVETMSKGKQVEADAEAKTEEIKVVPEEASGMGLQNMAERVQALGGTISFEGTNGFNIRVNIPVEVSA